MKLTKILIFALLPAVFASFSACSSLIECENIESRHAFILMDISDKKLFKEIESDLKDNFPGFMRRTGLGDISPCESFTFSFAHFGGHETLNISSKTIAIQRKGLSREEERRLANPKPLVQLMRNKIQEYDKLTDDRTMVSSTNITNVLVKTINQADLESNNIFLLFTDGVENSENLNLYKELPEEVDIKPLLRKLIEPSELAKFQLLQNQGLQANIVMVLKSEPANLVDRRAIKSFWTSVFDELGLSVQFIDNLSNQVSI